MTDVPDRQLSLLSTWRSPPTAPTSPHSSAPETRSSDATPSPSPVAATPTRPAPSAPASSTIDGASAAARPSGGARNTAGSGQQLTLPTTTTPAVKELRSLLGIPRPRTRADCLQEARPCPWVACRHHLLLEVATPRARQDSSARAPGLILNRPSTQVGRRPHLASSCAAELVRVWIDDALERLQAMPYSCSLDRADNVQRGPARTAEIGELLGCTSSQVKQERKAAIATLAARIKGDQTSGT